MLNRKEFDNLEKKHPLMRRKEYVRVLRQHMHDDLYKKSPKKILTIIAHLAIIISGYVGISMASHTWQYAIISLIIGHSLGCLGFLAHDLSHGTIISKGWQYDLLKTILFSLNAVPPTMWNNTHNKLHHMETNTILDPDREFRNCEMNFLRYYNSSIFWPNKRGLRWRPTVFLKYFGYLFSHTLGAITPYSWQPIFVAAKARYTIVERFYVIGEMAVILIIWASIFFIVGQQWESFIWAVPLPLVISSSILMTYIYTNHILNPLCDQTDPVVGSTSVIVPFYLDLIHDNFSYHTEHHLFPGVDSNFYPQISLLLQEHFPERYNRISLNKAWGRIWESDGYINEP